MTTLWEIEMPLVGLLRYAEIPMHVTYRYSLLS